MMNYIKLNFKFSLWIWLLGAAALMMNIVCIIIGYSIFGPFLTMVNLVSLLAFILMFQIMSGGYQRNESFRFYFSLPGMKTEIIKAMYVYHLLSLTGVTVIFTTWVIAEGTMILMFGLLMITGISLIMSSRYLYRFAEKWFKGLTTKSMIIYMVLSIILYYLYLGPFRVTVEASQDIWTGYYIILPFVVFAAGVVMNSISYIKSKNIISETDID